MESKNCKFAACQEDWDIGNPNCLCGEPDYKDCKSYLGTEEKVTIRQPEEVLNKEGDFPIPWSGAALGLIDMSLLTNQRIPLVIGVVGPHNAGKTTLLSTLYMLLRSGRQLGAFQFAGSYTLLGWEKIAHGLKLNAKGIIAFPPHTSANMSRVPGLLHLRLKDERGSYQDVLFTDAPGEWFREWSFSADASIGAQWIDEQADGFIVVADCGAFSKTIGKARPELLRIANRMKNTCQQRPIALAWTKSDLVLRQAIKTNMTNKVKNALGEQVKDYDVAVINLKTEEYLMNILLLVNDLLIAKYQSQNTLPFIETKNKHDFFFMLR